jgi:DNA-3-methyladenine glycosylase II
VAAWLAAELGEQVEVDGVALTALPTPEVLATIESVPGIPEVKVPRLAGVAQAALDGVLDGAHLRSLDADAARDELLAIPGIGPFSADLVLLRGAQHPDVFSVHEARLHQAMRLAYARPDADLDELESIAEPWSPVRSWVSVLVRSWAGDRPMMGA